MEVREIFQDKVLTFSNFLTLARIIAGPVLGYFIYKESQTGDSDYLMYEIIAVCIIILSDFFDGFLARLMNQVTRLGQFLDPVADKIAGLTAMTALVLFKGFPLWVCVLALAREAVAVIAGIILYRKRDIEVKPNWLGKLSAVSIAFAGTVYILSLDYEWQGISLKLFSVFLVVLFYVLGGIQYVRTYARYYIEKKA
ncbi:MAG TPA: CDP-alcohol phosphatidyltransferase family protein [Spirochaetota bacterium]|nr:CDP-alcohol phosphatidyltransferase family protein [Spirochaetota bacterium]